MTVSSLPARPAIYDNNGKKQQDIRCRPSRDGWIGHCAGAEAAGV